MKLVNRGASPRYSQALSVTLKPGAISRDIGVLADALDDVRKAASGFSVVLSDRDLAAFLSIARDWVLPALEGKGAKEASGAAALSAALSAPDGVTASANRYRAWRDGVMSAREAARRRKAEKEAAILAESNEIGPDGVPVPRAPVVGPVGGKPEARLHPEMSGDLKSIIENNLAVMTTASGKPIADLHSSIPTVRGEEPVPTDPAHYQKLARDARESREAHEAGGGGDGRGA